MNHRVYRCGSGMVRLMMGNIVLNVFIAPRLVLIPRIYEHGILPSSQGYGMQLLKSYQKILHVNSKKKRCKIFKKGSLEFVIPEIIPY